MFEIREETKEAAIEAMKEKIREHNETLQVSDVMLGECFDVAVDIVKKQFGM